MDGAKAQGFQGQYRRSDKTRIFEAVDEVRTAKIVATWYNSVFRLRAWTVAKKTRQNTALAVGSSVCLAAGGISQ